MQKENPSFPPFINITEGFHQVAQKAFSEHLIERVSSKLSTAEKAGNRLDHLYANDIVNLLNIISYRLGKQKTYKKQLVGILKQYHVLPNVDLDIKQMNQLARENLKNIQTNLMLQRNVFDALELIMNQEFPNSQRKKEILQKINQNDGKTFISFMEYLQKKTINVNNQKIINFMTSLQNFAEIEQVKSNLNILNETQRRFFEPIIRIYEQYINTQFQLQSQVQKKSSSLKTFFSFNKPKQVKAQIISKRGYERRQQTQPHKQQLQSYQLTIKKLQSEIDGYRRKDKEYSKLNQQNERYRSQIQQLKFSMVSDDQQQQKQLQIMIPFQAVTKQLQAEVSFLKKQLQIARQRQEKMKDQEVCYTKQIDRLENENYLLRLNQSKYKHNYAMLELLLKKYQKEQAIMQRQVSAWKQRVQQHQHFDANPKHQQNNRQDIEGEAFQAINNDQSDKIHQLSKQNNRLKNQISLIEQQLARLSQKSQLMATARQQKITNLQLKILDLTRQLTEQ